MKIIKYYITGLKVIFKLPYSFIRYFLIGIKFITLSLPIYIKNKILTLNQKEPSTKKIISLSILTISLSTYLISIFLLTRWYVQNERNKKFIDSFTEPTISININENEENITNEYIDTNNDSLEINTNNTTTQTYTPQFLNLNLNYYTQKNEETVGWLKIDGTKINYPLVQHNDNKYYLNHDFYNKKTNVGWIYADFRNNMQTLDNNTIIYGHNIIGQQMFGSLPTFLNQNWPNNKSQQYIKMLTKNQNTIWQIFSVYKSEPSTNYLQTRFGSIESYQEFLTTVKNKSIHNLDVNVDYTDKILTLTTCDNTGKYRVVIHAKLIKIQ